MSGPLPAVVSTEWLASNLGRPGLRVLDGSWYLPDSGRDPAKEYSAGHIPGALFFDLDATSDRSVSLPHMLPPPATFAEAMSGARPQRFRRSRGLRWIGRKPQRAAGLVDVPHVRARSSVRPGWRHRQMAPRAPPHRAGRRHPSPGRFTARLNRAAVRDLASVRANIPRRLEQLVDTRSAGRFAGLEPEPRHGLRGGHVPGSVNLPFTDLVRPDGTMLPPDELRRRLVEAGIDLSRPVVATCGSGTSACALVLGLHLIGHTQSAVYDGAWAEWGGRADTPIESKLT